jgi:hypothetical protein
MVSKTESLRRLTDAELDTRRSSYHRYSPSELEDHRSEFDAVMAEIHRREAQASAAAAAQVPEAEQDVLAAAVIHEATLASAVLTREQLLDAVARRSEVRRRAFGELPRSWEDRERLASRERAVLGHEGDLTSAHYRATRLEQLLGMPEAAG